MGVRELLLRRHTGWYAAAAAAAVVMFAALWAPARSEAVASAPEIELARKYAPVVRLKEHRDDCARSGAAYVPYEPVDVQILMGNDEVALRGPWDRVNLVRVAPTDADLAPGRFDYHLDFPGDALDPGCGYVEWSRRLAPEAPPTTYAHVVTEAGFPGKLALQYWFYYVFNDWNNNHEGDWEMIQLVFDATTPQQALTGDPVEVGYSQHSSAERAEWGDPKLELVDGTHPVVYPADGSQANFYGSGLYLMRSSAEGVGCDDTSGPSATIRPSVQTVPTASSDYLAQYPWLGFEGRWGEKQAAFFNGPTGPNMKTQWTQPITWSLQRWRDQSFAVPASGTLGTRATDFFCGAVATGSELLRKIKLNAGLAGIVIGGLGVLLLWALSKTRWEPTSPLRVPRRRRWGQLLSASRRMVVSKPRVFFGIGLLFVPLGIVIAIVQLLLFRVSGLAPLVDEAGERNAFVDALAIGLGLTLTLLGLAVVVAAVTHALVEIDAGRPVTAVSAYRFVARRLRPLMVALVISAAIQVLLDLTLVLLPVGIFLLVRWSMLAAVASVEGGTPVGMLRRSAALTRGHWWRVASIALGVTGAALLIGPAVGTLALLVTGAAFDVVNLISALVYVAVLPFPAVVLGYLYFDLRVREDLAPSRERGRGVLPAELELPAGGA